VPYHIAADFALAAAEKDVNRTKSLEARAKLALERSDLIEDTMLRWLKKWGH
jgi:hypothetical protein